MPLVQAICGKAVMPTIRIPLIGTFNQRTIDGTAELTASEDQRFLNCTFNVVTNPVTGKSVVYVERRPGWKQDTIPASGSASTGLLKAQTLSSALSAFGDANSVIYFGTTSVGTITGRALHFTETLISGTTYVAIKSSDGTGWYYVENAHQVTAYTADGNNSTTITDIKVSGSNSTAGLYPGQKLTAASNIPAGTRVVSVDSAAFTAVLDTATTGGAFNDLAITKEAIAKIADSDFVTTGTAISAFAEMDGYLFYSTDDGYVNNTDLNSVYNNSPNARIAVQMSPDPPVGVARQKNSIVVFGQNSKEAFYNAGLSSGSPLQRMPQFFERIGAVDQRSITVLENEIYFVSGPYEGDIGVYRMRDLQAQRISTPQIDRILGTSLPAGGAIYANSFRLGGYPYACFVLSSASEDPELLLLESGDALLLESGDNILLEANPAQSASYQRTLAYNATLNLWSEWDCDIATFIDSVGTGAANQLMATSRFVTDGKVYTINPTVDGPLWQDDGTTYTCEIRTMGLDFGTNKRKFVEEVRLICDKESTGTVTLEANDEDFDSTTWKTLGTFSLGTGEPKIHRCGSHKGKRSYRLTHSANGPFRAEALEIRYREGAH